MMKPPVTDIPEFYQPYVKALQDVDLVTALVSTVEELRVLLGGLNDADGHFRYADGKWSIKEVLQHLIDGERVFTYRALRFSRGDQTDLPGFEQDDYVNACNADERKVADLLREFENARSSTLDFYRHLPPQFLTRSGTANGFAFTVNAMGYITAGHLAHHLTILRDRYLPGLRA